MTTRHRELRTIAHEIVLDWGDKIYFGAKPYIGAMLGMKKITELYGADSGESIVLYFLANAGTWRGPVARRIKLELKQMLKDIESG